MSLVNKIEFNKYRTENLGTIRTVNYKNKEWFVLKDICNCLNIHNPTNVVKRLDKSCILRFEHKNVPVLNLVNTEGAMRTISRAKLSKSQKDKYKEFFLNELVPQIQSSNNEPNITTEVTNKSVETKSEQINNEYESLIMKKLDTINTKLDALLNSKQEVPLNVEPNLVDSLAKQKIQKDKLTFHWREWVRNVIEDLSIKYLTKTGVDVTALTSKQLSKELSKPMAIFYKKIYRKLEEENLINSIEDEVNILNSTYKNKKKKYSYNGLDVIAHKKLEKNIVSILQDEANKIGLETHNVRY